MVYGKCFYISVCNLKLYLMDTTGVKMGLLEALQSGNYVYKTNSQATITVTTGDGEGTYDIVGGTVVAKTGNGDQTFNITAANSCDVTTGQTGNDSVNVNAKKATINTNDSDDSIVFIGDLDDTTSESSITFGNGKSTAQVIANNVSVVKGNGDLNYQSVGDNMSTVAADGKHDIAFWGDNIDINLANGDSKIQTIDYAMADKNYKDFGAAAILDAQTITGDKTIVNTVQLPSSDVINGISNADEKAAIAKKYNLSPTEIKTLNGLDLSKTLASDGGPLYVIARSIVQSTPNNPVYVVCQRDSTMHTWSVTNHECVASGAAWNKTNLSYSTTSDVEQTYHDNYYLKGVTGITIKTGTGTNSDIDLTSNVDAESNGKSYTNLNSDGKADISINLGNSTKTDINIRNGYTVEDPTLQKTKISKTVDKSAVIWDTGVTYTSPLVVDFNKDGKVSATAGMGVDIDNNGTVDGAATGGDKMLAMSDINGNKKIDGQEVFGDQTVSPFTGEKINAANGFEALKVIAEQAKQYTGIDCIKNGSVDLQSLKAALAKVGVNLGFISDGNTTQLEDLGHIAAINVEDYAEANATGDVQNRQLGSYTDTDGSTQKIDDVWFASQPSKNTSNFFEILKKLG